MTRRTAGLAIVAASALCAGAALAQTKAPAEGYPVRPVRVIVPNTAGSATDLVSRIVAQRLSETLGKQMVVDNRAGAGGAIGHEIAARAAPDGHTLLVTTLAGLVIVPLLTEIVKMFADPSFAKRITDQGQDPAAGTPAQLAAHVREEAKRWARVVKEAGLAEAR